MSRSKPQENASPNPCTRWHEWNGEKGIVRYYDREAKQNVDVGPKFAFVLLDQLGTVGGWHDASDSGIYANEVKDTRQDVLIVKSFKGGIIAEGLYRDIKDKVAASGGKFVANCYIAYTLDVSGALALGSIKFSGAALHAWTEFTKEHRAELFDKGVRITGFDEGKKGRIVYRTPVLKMVDLVAASNASALKLDALLQSYLDGYLKRPKREQVDDHTQPGADEPPPDNDWVDEIPAPEDDIPF